MPSDNNWNLKRVLWNCTYPSVQFSCSVVSDSLGPHELQHSRPPCPSPTPGVHSNSCPWSRWCHPAISSSIVPLSSCLPSFPASESFQRSQFFTSGGQNTDVSASASVLPMNIKYWFPLGLTGWISSQETSPTSQFKTINSFSSFQFSRSVMSDSLRPHESQHARPPCPSPTPGVHSDSRPSSQWCHPAISSSVVPFSACPQSLSASESFPMSQLFAWGGQNAVYVRHKLRLKILFSMSYTLLFQRKIIHLLQKQNTCLGNVTEQ